MPARTLITATHQDVGTIGGTVTDPNGGLISGTKIHISNNDTGIAQDLTASDSGFFQSQPLAPGKYTVTVTAVASRTSPHAM